MIIQPRIYLASQSPRRRDLLKQIGVNYQMLLPRVDPNRTLEMDETPHQNELPEAYVQRICQEKAKSAWGTLQLRNLPEFPILVADTSVTLDGKIIGKPLDRDQAAATLRLLSGRQHQVLSAVAITFKERIEMRLSVNKVTFSSLSEERIQHYLFTNEYMDKAGAYAIQGHAAAFIQHLDGSYSSVMGLPLFETAELLQAFGCPIL